MYDDGGPVPAQVDNAPGTAIDLSNPDNWHASVPVEEFARLRREAPVAWNERTDGHRGFWVISKHADIVSVSRRTQEFSSRNGVISLDDFDSEQNEARRTLLEMDPPQHTGMRRVTSPKFTPRAISRLETAVRGTAGRLVENVLELGTFDAVSHLSKPLPITTLCHLMGIPEDRRDDMVRWSDLLIGSDDPEYVDPSVAAVPEADRRLLPFGHPASLEAFELGRELAAVRRLHATDDVVGALALGTHNGEPLTDQEFCNYFLMLVVAGNETTRHTISHGLNAFAEHPSEWDRFTDGEIDANVAADEVLRWASAVHFVRRVVVEDIEFAGVSMNAGDKVAMYYTSGNRDEDVFDEPDRFRIDRTPNNHVAFGRGGPHFCIGAHLARLQVRVLLEELAHRVASIESNIPPDRLRSNHINGIKQLEITVGAR